MLMKICVYFLNCWIFLINASPLVEVEETDVITFLCPRNVSSMSLSVTYNHGETVWLAGYKEKNCATFSDMKCSHDNDKNLLTIPVSRTSRTIVSYICGDNHVYNVSFYAEPQGFKCSEPTIDSTGKNVSVTCTTSKVFPPMDCSFIDIFNDTTIELTDGSVNLEHSETSEGPMYYKGSCVFTIRISNLPLGNHQLHVNVRPMNINKTYTYNITPDVALWPLETEMDPFCPHGRHVVGGFIKANTPATCGCQMKSNNVSIGSVYWSKGSNLNENINTYSTYVQHSFTYPEDHGETYFCNALPINAQPGKNAFQPKFAFGPDQVILSQQSIKVETCKTLTVSCSTTSDGFNPGVKFDWYTDNPKALLIEPIAQTSNQSTIRLTALMHGKYILTCKGTNTIFEDFFSESDIIVIIEAIKLIEPKFTVKAMKNDSIMVITCSVEEDANLTLACLDKTESKRTTSLSMTVNFTSSQEHDVLCNCTSIYSCYGKSVAHYRVRNAFGPSVVNVSSKELELDLCNETTLTVSVPDGDVYPEASFNISVDISDAMRIEQEPSNFSSLVSISAQKTGQFHLKITAYNKHNEEIQATTYVKIVVKDTKSTRPIVSYNNGKVIKEGLTSDNVNITCTDPTGNATFLMLNCWGTNSTSNGTDVKITMNLTRWHNKEVCDCYLELNQSCNYRRNTTAAVNVTYEARIASFNINKNHSIIEVSEEDNVTLNCVVSSNPKPNVYIKTKIIKHYSPAHIYRNTTTEIGPNKWQLLYEIRNISCNYTATYTCVADNGLFGEEHRQSITVFVKCGVQLIQRSHSTRKVPAKLNGLVSISIDIMAHPKPKTFLLTNRQDNISIENSSYLITYKHVKLAYGAVILFFDRITEDHFKEFTVNVSNGIGNDLEVAVILFQEDVYLDETSIIIISVLASALFVAITLVVVTCVIYKKAKKTDNSEKRNRRPPSQMDIEKAERLKRSLLNNEVNKSTSQDVTTEAERQCQPLITKHPEKVSVPSTSESTKRYVKDLQNITTKPYEEYEEVPHYINSDAAEANEDDSRILLQRDIREAENNLNRPPADNGYECLGCDVARYVGHSWGCVAAGNFAFFINFWTRRQAYPSYMCPLNSNDGAVTATVVNESTESQAPDSDQTVPKVVKVSGQKAIPNRYLKVTLPNEQVDPGIKRKLSL